MGREYDPEERLVTEDEKEAKIYTWEQNRAQKKMVRDFEYASWIHGSDTADECPGLSPFRTYFFYRKKRIPRENTDQKENPIQAGKV